MKTAFGTWRMPPPWTTICVWRQSSDMIFKEKQRTQKLAEGKGCDLSYNILTYLKSIFLLLGLRKNLQIGYFVNSPNPTRNLDLASHLSTSPLSRLARSVFTQICYQWWEVVFVHQHKLEIGTGDPGKKPRPRFPLGVHLKKDNSLRFVELRELHALRIPSERAKRLIGMFMRPSYFKSMKLSKRKAQRTTLDHPQQREAKHGRHCQNCDPGLRMGGFALHFLDLAPMDFTLRYKRL